MKLGALGAARSGKATGVDEYIERVKGPATSCVAELTEYHHAERCRRLRRERTMSAHCSIEGEGGEVIPHLRGRATRLDRQ